MTRVFERAFDGARTRALIIGAGHYPHANGTVPGTPQLANLTSVPKSIMAFTRKLVEDWRDTLLAPLGSVDLLLSDASAPAGAVWPGFGVAGEIAAGAAVDKANLQEVQDAFAACLEGSTVSDVLLFMCCGHGFWRGGGGYFVLSDFAAKPLNPWANIISLQSFRIGLTQMPPRNQWLYFDCCSDFPNEVLRTLGEVGDPLVQPTADGIVLAQRQFGTLWQYGMGSSTVGQQAFGVPDMPSRFCEMLIEALDGAGAITRVGGQWWVDQLGIEQAVKSYWQRKPDLADPNFYNYPMPISSDAPGRMRFRRLDQTPTSCVIATSVPPTAIKNAAITIETDERSVWEQQPPGSKAKIHVALPGRRHYLVKAQFGAIQQDLEIFADLPLGESVEFIVP